MNRNNEIALDTFADILLPLSNIMSDVRIAEVYKNKEGGGMVAAVRAAIKTHKEDIIEILATLDGVPVDEYEVSVMSLPIKVVKILNDPEVQTAFSGQGQKKKETSSGSATENIQGVDG